MERLLCVSLCLLTFTGKTFGDNIDVKSKEDEDVILPCSFKESLTDKRFDWKKDGEDVFLYENGKPSTSIQPVQFKDRVSYFHEQLHSGNASISIKKARVSDSGTYACLFIDSGESYKIELTVVSILKDRTNDPERYTGAVAKPSLIIVEEKPDQALLRCEVVGAFPKPSLVLYDSAGKNISVKEPEVSEQDGRYNVVLEATVTKTDNYTCVATQETLHHQSNITTHLLIGGAVAKPSFIIVEQKTDQALLRCEVFGAFPKPSLVWYDSAGKKISVKEPEVSEQDGRYYVALETTVTKTDRYTCVATQEKLHHQSHITTHLFIGDEAAGMPKTTFFMLLLVLLVSLLLFLQ